MESLEAWRARIGGFVMPGTRPKFRPPVIKVAGGYIRALVFTLVIAAPLVSLLSDGDVEANPGPGPGARSSTRQATLSKTGGIETTSPDTLLIIEEMKTMKNEIVSELRVEMDTRFQDLSVKIEELSVENVSLREEIKTVQTENTVLKTRIDNIDDRSRRCNLMIYGIEENPDAPNTTVQLTSVLNSVDIEIDEQEVAYAVRRGKQEAGKIRPVMVEFTNVKARNNTLQSVRAKKVDGIYAGEDYCEKTRDIRRCLNPLLKQKRKLNLSAVLKYRSLVVRNADGRVNVYTCDAETMEVTQVKEGFQEPVHPPQLQPLGSQLQEQQLRRPPSMAELQQQGGAQAEEGATGE